MSQARGKASPQEIEYMITHYSDNRAPELVAALSINIALAIIFVFLRWLARRTIKSPIQADDWMIFISLVIACGQYITGMIGVHVGLGRHSIVQNGDYAPWAKCSIAYAILYVVATALVKISVLCLYRRLFGSQRNFKLATWLISGIIIIYTSVSALGSSFQCIPVASLWDLSIDGYCFNYRLAAFINAILNIIMEIVIMVLPAHAVWSLQLGTKLKLQILAILLLGAFVTVGTIYLLTTLHKITFVDATWGNVDPIIWSMVEVGIGIVCACLPTLRPLVSANVRNNRRATSYTHFHPQTGRRQVQSISLPGESAQKLRLNGSATLIGSPRSDTWPKIINPDGSGPPIHEGVLLGSGGKDEGLVSESIYPTNIEMFPTRLHGRPVIDWNGRR